MGYRLRYLSPVLFVLTPRGGFEDLCDIAGSNVACPLQGLFLKGIVFGIDLRDLVLIRFGGALLSHALRRSTIGATVLNCRVRDGTGCFTCAMTTKPNKNQSALSSGYN